MGDSQSKQFGTQYLDKLGDQLDKKAPVFGQSLFAGAGDATKNAWSTGNTFGKSLVSSNGYGNGQLAAQNSLGGVFSGYGDLGTQYSDLADAYDPNSAAYQTLRNKLTDDTLTGVGSLFASNGRYGSDIMSESAAEGLGTALAGLDYNNMTADINNRYRSLDSQAGALGGQAATAGQQFGMGQQALTNKQGAIDLLTQIGAAKDANAQGKLLGKADLYDRTKNAELDRLIKIGAAFGDPTAAANEPGFLQQLLGGVLGFGGSLASGGAFNK